MYEMWVYVTAATVLVASVLFSVVMMLVGVCIKVSRVKSEDPASERRDTRPKAPGCRHLHPLQMKLFESPSAENAVTS